MKPKCSTCAIAAKYQITSGALNSRVVLIQTWQSKLSQLIFVALCEELASLADRWSSCIEAESAKGLT
jgi:hypothetical protein